MPKAAEAFRTISEVADDLGVEKHVLRFWEARFSQLKPMKRGGGRRYYRPEDIELLRGIQRLLYRDNYTIKGVQRILRERGIEFVKSCWKEPAGAGVDRAVPAPARARARTRVAPPPPPPAQLTKAERREALIAALRALEEARAILKGSARPGKAAPRRRRAAKR